MAPGYFAGLNLTHRTFANLQAGVNAITNQASILVHPLWDSSSSNCREEIAAASAQAEREGLVPVLRSVLRAVRFPYE